jgi:hypothetical protein
VQTHVPGSSATESGAAKDSNTCSCDVSPLESGTSSSESGATTSRDATESGTSSRDAESADMQSATSTGLMLGLGFDYVTLHGVHSCGGIMVV